MQNAFGQSLAKTLCELAKNIDNKGNLVPMNKSQLQKKAKIYGRQTILNVVGWLKHHRYVIVENKEWRKGRSSEHYTLSESGLYRAVQFNPKLEDSVRKALGAKYQEFENRVEQGRRRDLDFYFNVISTLILKRKGRPDSEWSLTVRTDDQGRVGWEWKTGPAGH